VFGQDKAIDALTSAIKLARAGLRDQEKPIGSYLFSARRASAKPRSPASSPARWASSSPASTCPSTWSATRSAALIGAPPGYVGFDQGGLLTDAIDQHPHQVLLLDEIEKAHPDLFNILLQVMDYGKLTDHNGKNVDFRNVILIMDHQCRRGRHGQGSDRVTNAPPARARTRTDQPDVHAGIRNRLDCDHPVRGADARIIQRVVDKFVIELEGQLADRGVMIETDRRRPGSGSAARVTIPRWRAAAGAHHPGIRQETAGGGAPVRQAVQRRFGAAGREGWQGRVRLSRGQAAGSHPRRPGKRRSRNWWINTNIVGRMSAAYSANLDAWRNTLRSSALSSYR